MAIKKTQDFDALLSSHLRGYPQPNKDHVKSLLSAIGTSPKGREFAAALAIVIAHTPPSYGPHGLGSKKSSKKRASRKKAL